MAKSSKKSKEATVSEVKSVAPDGEAQNGTERAVSEKVAAGKPIAPVSKSSRKRPASSTRKAATGEKPRKQATKKKPAPAVTAVSDDAIRLRAYFIAERRMQNGVGGDSASDWLEARRQLLAEAIHP
jgi:hypothetical protein